SGAALDDRGVEKSLCGWRGQMGKSAEATGRLAADRHSGRVSAEMADIVADPFECELLVHQAVITGDPIAVQGTVGEQAECAETIVDGHDDDLVGADQDAGVELRAGTGHEPAAMHEYPDRHPVVAPRMSGCRDVEEEAILIEGLLC